MAVSARDLEQRREALQLRMAEDKIVQLEAEISAYKHRAERAETWLRRIEQEIEKTFVSRQTEQAGAGSVSGNAALAL